MSDKYRVEHDGNVTLNGQPRTLWRVYRRHGDTYVFCARISTVRGASYVDVVGAYRDLRDLEGWR